MYVCMYVCIVLFYWVWWFAQLLMYSVGRYKSWTRSTRTASPGRNNPDRLGWPPIIKKEKIWPIFQRNFALVSISFYFIFLMIRCDPSQSELIRPHCYPDWRSELIRSNFCIRLMLDMGESLVLVIRYGFYFMKLFPLLSALFSRKSSAEAC